MSSRSGRRTRSRSRSRSRSSGRSRDSRRSSRREDERPWLKRSQSRSVSPRSRSRSRSPRRRVHRSRTRSPPPRPVMSKDPKFLNSRVFVANLASDKTSNAELLALFEKHGKVLDTLVHHNGYGFVQFASEEEGRQAVEAENGTMFHGKKIKCNMAAEGKRGGGGGGRPGADRPNERPYGRDRSPMQDPYPPPFSDPYMRPRDLPPPPRDLLPPPRDPFFDDPYRRPPPPDPYYDRFRDDPYRRDPYPLDPFRDPYRDPYVAPLYDTAAPKKPVTVDCEIIVMTSQLRHYADMVERRLKNLNLLTSIVVIREDRTIQQQVEEATRRSCLFAIVINSQNEIHRSLTLNILHGVAQEHRNMPLDDALSLVARSFEKFLQAEKEKVAALSSGTAAATTVTDPVVPSAAGHLGTVSFLPPPKEISYLLNLLADNRQLTADELDKVIAYLKERKSKLLAAEGLPPVSEVKPAAAVPTLQQQQYQQKQQEEQQQQQQQHQELQNKILSMMNGTSAPPAPTGMTLPQNTMATRVAPLMPALSSTRPPPPPPQPQTSQESALTALSRSTLLGASSLNPLSMNSVLAVSSQSALLSVTSPPSVSAVQGPAPAATLINFDNPTVQKALDNLIQSGPNLLRNISVSQAVGQGTWPGQATTTSVSQPGLFPAAAPGSQRPAY